MRFGWNATYTYTYLREQVSGFSSTAGNPLDVAWATSGQGPHQVSYNVRYNFFNTVQVNWQGQFRSGSAYTPVVAGDVNGDGYSNDRAFVFDPARTADSALAVQIPQHRQIISFRNVLIHGYDSIDEAVVWKIIQQDLPDLKQQVETMLADLVGP